MEPPLEGHYKNYLSIIYNIETPSHIGGREAEYVHLKTRHDNLSGMRGG